jgi:hypothetical protein
MKNFYFLINKNKKPYLLSLFLYKKKFSNKFKIKKLPIKLKALTLPL